MAARRLSVTEWTLGAPDTGRAIEIVANAGYGAIELSADPGLDVEAAQARLDEHGLTVSSLCGVYDLQRDCAHESQRRRRLAGDYLRASLESASRLEAAVLVVVPTYRVEEDTDVDREAELERAAETIAGAATELSGAGPTIVLEALNRYETHLVRTLAEAEQLRRRIDSAHVRLMADVFHMNIEEDSIAIALRQHAAQIAHIHLADNQRRAPGSGQLDLAAILGTLDDVGYHGSMTMEFLPATEETLTAGRKAVERGTAAVDHLPRKNSSTPT